MCFIDSSRGATDHIRIRISHPGFKARYMEDSSNHALRRIRMFMWSFGAPVLQSKISQIKSNEIEFEEK